MEYLIKEEELKGLIDKITPYYMGSNTQYQVETFLKSKQPVEELAEGIYRSGKFDLEKDWIKFIIKDLRVTCSADGLVNNKVRILAEVSK